MRTSLAPYQHRGQYRFRTPIDYRYEFYSWPKNIASKCTKCGSRVEFAALTPEPQAKDEASGGFRLIRQHIAGEISGQGACARCGQQTQRIRWPYDAYFQFSVAGGIVWAWNEKYLCLLRAHASGNRVLERHICLEDGLYHYFLTRLPKHVVVKRNRERILSKIDDLLSKSRPAFRLTWRA